jgi:hypothetical protein
MYIGLQAKRPDAPIFLGSTASGSLKDPVLEEAGSAGSIMSTGSDVVAALNWSDASTNKLGNLRSEFSCVSTKGGGGGEVCVDDPKG